MEFFINFLSIECVLITLKFKGYFVKLTFTKSRRLFYKISIHGLWVNFTKIWESFFAKLMSPTVPVSGRPIQEFWPTWIPPGAEKCTKLIYKRCTSSNLQSPLHFIWWIISFRLNLSTWIVISIIWLYLTLYVCWLHLYCFMPCGHALYVYSNSWDLNENETQRFHILDVPK